MHLGGDVLAVLNHIGSSGFFDLALVVPRELARQALNLDLAHGLGELVGKARGRVVLKGLGIDDVELGRLGLLGKGVGNARAIRITGVVEQGDLGVCILLGQELRGAAPPWRDR